MNHTVDEKYIGREGYHETGQLLSLVFTSALLSISNFKNPYFP